MSERKDRRDETALRPYRGAAIERAIDTALNACAESQWIFLIAGLLQAIASPRPMTPALPS
jgi:hypothetical protein